jgi:diacylglycerol kinase (ATP)
MRATIIRNPTSGSSPMANQAAPAGQNEIEDRILNNLRHYNIEAEVRYTTADDPGAGLAREAAQAGIELVIAAGGDGTLHSVASGLIGSKSILGILPCGTMNNIAYSLHISENIDEACQIIAEGETGCIDVGSINGHIFLEVSGIGLEAALFPAAEDIKSPGFRETIRGVINGIRTLFSFHPERVKITFDDGHTRSYRALQISVCNSPFYGAHLQFAPQATMDDGYLDTLIYQNFSKLEYILHAIAISQGQRVFEPKVKRWRIKKLYITARTPLSLHADGEQIGTTPAKIEIIPAALRVRIPQRVIDSANISQHQPLTPARRAYT